MKERILGLVCLLLISGSLCAMTAQTEVQQTQVAQNELNQQLVSEAKEGNVSLIKGLLKRGALIVGKDYCLTAVDWAAIRGHTECIGVMLDELENNTPLARQKTLSGNYALLGRLKVRWKNNRWWIIDLFQRDERSLDELVEHIRKIRQWMEEDLDHYDPLVTWLQRILTGLKVQFSLNFVLSCSNNRPALQQALVSAGAQHTDDTPLLERLPELRTTDPYLYRVLMQAEGLDDDFDEVNNAEDLMQMHINSLVHFATQLENEELLRALIEVGANVNDTDDDCETSLHHVAHNNNAHMAKLLLDAKARIEDKDSTKRSAFEIACACRSFDVAKILYESGARIRSGDRGNLRRPYLDFSSSDRQLYFKMLLQGSKRRYMPTRKEAKRALQNVACLIDILGMRCNLPAYVIYEILLFVTAEQHDAQGQEVAPEWTKAFKRDLEVIYLYKCNGNKLFPLWEQTMRCLVKDPQKQALIIAKLVNFMQPFFGDDVKNIVCLSLMGKFADDSESLPVGQDHELYCKHLAGYLYIDGLDDL